MLHIFKTKQFKIAVISLCLIMVPVLAGAIVKITDPGSSGQPVKGQQLTLTFEDGTTKEAKTDDDGILFWLDGTRVDKLPDGTTIGGGFLITDVTHLFKAGDLAQNGCALPDPSKYQPIEIGPNDKYGSTARLKKKTAGMIGGPMGGALGGRSSGSFGMGSKGFGGGGMGQGSSSSVPKMPELVKDPTSGNFVNLAANGTTIGVRGGFTDQGLVISSQINEAPGKGTFHVIWLENSEGKRIFPIRYFIISIYAEWTLTVSWTYDHWTNGVHDEHREGGWSESWREHFGDFRLFIQGKQAIKRSAWYLSGFDMAVAGVKHIGAVFPLTPADLSGPHPAHVVIHVSKPATKPTVTTVPFVADLFARKKKDKKDNIIVLVRPHVLRDPA
jgi:hypothetical protein